VVEPVSDKQLHAIKFGAKGDAHTLTALKKLTKSAIIDQVQVKNVQLSEVEERVRYYSKPLTEGFKKHNHMALSYNLLFVFRRFILLMAVFASKGQVFFQIMTYMVSSLAWVIFIIIVKPFREKNLNYQEIFNEIFCWIIGAHAICFALEGA
jgi:hypothetical protein